MMTANLRPIDPVFEALCRQAGAEPDDVAAVVVFRKGKRTLVLSATLLSGLLEVVVRGVKVEKVSYPSGNAMWRSPRICSWKYVLFDLGFNPKADAWTIRVHDGKYFQAEGKSVVVYE